VTTFEDAQRIALALPGAEQVGTVFKVAGKNFAAVYPERVDPKKARVPNYGVFMVWVADLGDKEAYLKSDPAKFFTTDHYDGYPSVLVRLDRVDETELEQLIREAWMTKAPPNLELSKSLEG
jgi:hypothetical protein